MAADSTNAVVVKPRLQRSLNDLVGLILLLESHSRLPPEPEEAWQHYIYRLGRLVQETGVHCILRPLL